MLIYDVYVSFSVIVVVIVVDVAAGVVAIAAVSTDIRPA